MAAALLAAAGLSILAPPPSCYGQLPPESQLPAERAGQDDRQAGEAQPPSEADLPEQPRDQDAAPPREAVPSEAALPGAAEAAGESADTAALPGGERPWLRLAFPGHTGLVRALDLSTDGRTLVSGGEDKDLHVWRRSERSETGWRHHRTIRWQVARGPRGRINAVAARGERPVAMAGNGAMGDNGEIWVVDSESGDLVRPLIDVDAGHNQVVNSLAWAPGQTDRLASADMEGRVMLWQADPSTGLWSGKQLVGSDTETFGSQWAAAMRPLRRFVPVVFAGEQHVIYGRFLGPNDQRTHYRWQLVRLNIENGQSQRLENADHVSFVMDLDATADGKILVSSDAAGQVFVWDLGENGTATSVEQIAPGGAALFLDLDADGQRLLIGTAPLSSDQQASSPRVQMWDLSGATPEKLSDTPLKDFALDGLLDTARSEAILATANRIDIHAVDENGQIAAERRSLEVPAKPITRLAWTKQSDRYEIAFDTDAAPEEADDTDTFRGAFDLSGIRLLEQSPVDAQGFLPEPRTRSRWSVGPAAAPEQADSQPQDQSPRGEFQLFQDGQPRGVLPLKRETHGVPTATTTLPVTASDAEPADAEPADAEPVDADASGEPESPDDGSPQQDDDKASSGADAEDAPQAGAGTESDPAAEQPAAADAVIVGTSGRNNIYVYAADDSDPPRLLRQFRGHTGTVRALAVSADGRYLASGSDDATMAIWNLADVTTASDTVNRWGVEFEVQNGELIASEVRDDGPLYFRGVRGGDRLVSIEWADENNQLSAETQPAAMQQRLSELPFDTLVAFQFSRLGSAREEFQSYPAWRPLATLFVDETREWAFWTPAGYYDASFNGHQRFGWQINRGVSKLPDYFRAAQFQEALERPQVMRRLLSEGSLTRAMRQTVGQLGPPPGEAAILNQYHNKPRIRLLSPQPGDTIAGDSLTVRAEITVPLGASLVEPKAFVSGVPALGRCDVSRVDDASRRAAGGAEPGVAGADGATYLCQWQFRLPQDRTLQLELLAATEAEAVDRVLVPLSHQPSGAPRRKPRLHLIAVGASRYQDPQIQSLDFAANAAGVVSDLLRERAAPLYTTTADQLVDRDATRPLWRVYAEQAAETLSRTVSPDDLVIMYLSGHGLRDRRTDQWYFVASDARYRDLMNDQYDDCIAFSDLALLSRLPCRKLAILDSCHSGAVQPVMRGDDLKSALRFLQDDLVLTLTASEGDEEAAEQRETGLGRFTTRLVEALRGAADEAGGGNGVVSLDETIDYVTQTVTFDSQRDGMPQHPTASPEYLLRTLQLPLTAAGASK